MKPQDSLVVLKYCSIQYSNHGKNHATGLKAKFGVRALSEVLGISASEISKSVKRLTDARLVAVRDSVSPVEQNVLEWFVHGLKYYLPLEVEGYGRGVATGWNCQLIDSEMVAPQPGWAWSTSKGDVQAELIKPFHASVPLAIRHDDWLYRCLSVIEVI
jgi:hypothetical protein